jgi:hypothetical protein
VGAQIVVRAAIGDALRKAFCIFTALGPRPAQVVMGHEQDAALSHIGTLSVVSCPVSKI